MIRLTKEQVLSIHTVLIKAIGGTDGIRDVGLLESALAAPFQTFGGQDLYPALLQKAACLGFSLISDHPFVDGNKRIGIHTMLVYLALNGVEIDCSEQELIDVGLALADGKMSLEALLTWLSSHN